MVNPNKHIRKVYVDTFSAATGLPVWENSVPKDVPSPSMYILVRNQNKDEFARAKGVYEWRCDSIIDIVSVQEKGYSHQVSVDDVEEQILTVMEGVAIPGFNTKYVRLIDSHPLDTETSTHTINRTVLIYEHWLNKAI